MNTAVIVTVTICATVLALAGIAGWVFVKSIEVGSKIDKK